MVKDKEHSCLIGIFLTALIVPAFLPRHFFGKKYCTGCPKIICCNPAHTKPLFLIHLLNMQGVGTYLLTFCF